MLYSWRGVVVIASIAPALAAVLAPNDIQSTFFTGQPFTASTLSNVKFKMVFTADGKMTREPVGKTGAKDEGTWKLTKDGFCTTWKGSTANCFRVADRRRQQVVGDEGHDRGRDLDEVSALGRARQRTSSYSVADHRGVSRASTDRGSSDARPTADWTGPSAYCSVSKRMERASNMTSRPTRPSPKPTISRITSSAISEPSTPVSAPRMPASAQAGTLPGGGGSGNRQR